MMESVKFLAWDSVAEAMIGSPCGNGDREYSIGWSSNGTLSMFVKRGSHFYKLGNFMQYTGWKDENHTEIFEGDIVRMHYFFFDGGEGEGDIQGEVKMDKYGPYIEEPSTKNHCYLWDYDIADGGLAILGNIWQHPYLLETEASKEEYRKQLGRLSVHGDMGEQAHIARRIRYIGMALGYSEDDVRRDIQEMYHP